MLNNIHRETKVLIKLYKTTKDIEVTGLHE